jgi:hypothetical protein
MFVDFTKSVSSNLSNKVNTSYSSTVNSPELGESYGVFISSLPSVYGGNQSEEESTDIDICSTAENVLACTLGTSACPAECITSELSIAKVNTAPGNLVGNRSNIFLGAFDITNTGGTPMNLESLNFDISGSS